MSYLTLVAKVEADPAAREVLLDAMLSGTKVYNGLIWELRQEYEQTGKSKISKQNLNKILKTLPRAKAYYSLSVQATRDEVLGAYQSYFALKKAGYADARPPGFRRKNSYSGLRYYDGYGVTLNGNRLNLSLGLSRLDGVRQVTVCIQYRADVVFRRLVNVLLTYDTSHGMEAHLVVEVKDGQANGTRKVAVDLGETQAISAMFDDGTNLLYSGREIKAIRRYWQKVRAKVKPPTAENCKKSRRYHQIERKESRQVHHLLHLISKDFVERCSQAGVDTIAIGELIGIRKKIDYGERLNQRLHAWPFAKLTNLITYKAKRYGIQIIKVDEAYSSQTCHACRKVAKSNRKTRGSYACVCGWHAHADVNASANLFQSAFQVSPLKGSSGDVASPAVMSLITRRHMVCKA
jgi:IS605 OrfB family transposase